MTSSYGFGASGASPPATERRPDFAKYFPRNDSTKSASRPATRLRYSTDQITVHAPTERVFLALRGHHILTKLAHAWVFPATAKSDLDLWRAELAALRAEQPRQQTAPKEAPAQDTK